MASFPIYPLARFESGATTIRRPRQFLQFSFDEQRKIHFSDLSLRYYYPPFIQAPGTPVPSIPLSKGYENWVKSDDSIDHHLDGLLDTIQSHEESLLENGTNVDDVRLKSDIITWRGMMTKIMTVAFDNFSDFEMNATCYQGTIFIEENFSYASNKEKEQNSRKPSNRQQVPQEMMQYWGYKFEALSTLPRPWSDCTREEIDSRQENPINTNIQYCSIARTGIGATTLVLGGEIDCLMGDRPTNPDDPNIPWVELKTSLEPHRPNASETAKFERKLCRFWAQSFLLGVPKIIVGFRTPEGQLTRIQDLETQKLPGQVSRSSGVWDGNVCINMTAGFLEFLKETIGGREGVWRIRRERGARAITVVRVEEGGTGGILKEGFKAHREKLVAAEVARKLGEEVS